MKPGHRGLAANDGEKHVRHRFGMRKLKCARNIRAFEREAAQAAQGA
jgi:hypothetical protein